MFSALKIKCSSRWNSLLTSSKQRGESPQKRSGVKFFEVLYIQYSFNVTLYLILFIREAFMKSLLNLLEKERICVLE